MNEPSASSPGSLPTDPAASQTAHAGHTASPDPSQTPASTEPANAPAQPETNDAPGTSNAPEQPNTQNSRLSDGVNRCPKCGSTEIQLRPSTGMLICLFCRHEWSEAQVADVLGQDDDLRNLAGTIISSGASNIDPEVSGTLTLKCAGCGSEVVIHTEQALHARCHWCRHVLTVNEQVPNGAVPDAVLPFSVTHGQAVEHIRKFASKRKVFAHRTFVNEFTPENVVGVYLPYMVIDSNASADVWGQGEILTRTYTRGDGDDKKTYYDADVYQVQRHVDFVVDDLTIESSADRANMNPLVNTNNIINTILPFDTKSAVQWNASYLTGFTSEKRDQDVTGMQPVLDDQLLSIARSRVEGSVAKYDRGVRWEQERLEVHGSRWVSMYLPVWLYSYYHEERGKGMVHYIAVNGRTGETMGSVPVSRGRLLAAALTVGTVLEGIAIALLVATA